MQVCSLPKSPCNSLPHHSELQKGLTHGFVMEFASVADRDYYVAKDPAHAKAGAELLKSSEELVVVDYEVGVF
jgi:Stress responsive A/B Barrel Domain